MPIHDGTRVDAGVYHNFHQDGTIEICRTLNRGILPPGFFAMADQRVSGPEPGVIAPRMRGPEPTGGLAVAERPPRMAQPGRLDAERARYAAKANRIAIRQGLGRVVAMIEVVSPGNKDGRSAVASFVDKAVQFARNGIHLLLIDPFPPGPHDPGGIARLVWEELGGEPFPDPPAGKPLAVAAIDAGEPLTAYVEGLAVGDSWPEAPLFLEPGWYVEVPLEQTYRTSWEVTPDPIRDRVESPSSGSDPERSPQ